ncbi:MAG TPA: 5-methyltetrahydropteroyltriglutamate--homocysteine S-methyltransferase [Alphaproteobacteria bacterium]|nr:5-methyltetrahydropteroyltriglutamate--homocysteine S-methyltransferase [Alphaproteobacteria bacterium]
MASRTKPPFRADHVGSLLRPKALLEAREAHKAGRIDAAALKAAEDEAIRGAVKLQEDVGLQGVTDGEYRRASWHMDFLYQVGGVTKVQDNISVKFHNEKGDLEFTPAALRITARLALGKTIFADAFTFLKSATHRTPKLTIPSPSMMHYRGGRAAIDEKIYPTLDRFWDDLGAVYADEIEALGKLGCTYLQLDDTSLAYLNDPAQRAHVAKLGGDPDAQHLTYIKLINSALRKKPPGMTVCTHLCRGNFRSSWVASGGYDHVADALFNRLEVDGYFLEYDDARSGGFEPLRYVPKGKMVVLGLITTKKGALEKKDALKRRIDEAAKFMPLDQICLSPQCGFSSTVEGNALSIEEEIAKLRLVVETAREVWG